MTTSTILGRRRPLAGVAGLLAVGLALAGCGSSLIGSSTTTSPAGSGSSTTTPASTTSSATGEVAVAFPVVTCVSSSGATLGTSGWRPTVLLAPIPTTLVGQVEFYSDGVHTVLGPDGWTCAQTPPTAGVSGLVVYPPGVTDPSLFGTAPAGAEGIFASYASTGSAAGIALVCPFFTVPTWQQNEGHCSSTKPPGEQSSLPTPDVASVIDSTGNVGSLQGSGGSHAVTGAVIFPQVLPAVTYGTSEAVAAESCSLIQASLCPTILSDFEVREFPVPAASER